MNIENSTGIRSINNLLIILILILLLINGITLLKFPLIHGDEAWYASRALGLIKTGRAFGELDSGVIDKFDKYWASLPFLPTLIQSLGVRLVGEPNILSMRIVSFFGGCLLLSAIFVIGKTLDGYRLGLIAVILVAASKSFLFSGHMGRVDIIASVAGYWAIALYLINQDQKWILGLFTGLLLGFAFEIHPHSIVFIPTLIILYFNDHRFQMFRQKSFWWFTFGGLISLILYIIFHVIPSPPTYFAINQILFTETHIPPLLTFSPKILGTASIELLIMTIIGYPLLPVACYAGIKLIREKIIYGSQLTIIATCLFLGVMFLIRNKIFYYAILYFPALDLLVAAYLFNILKQSHGKKPLIASAFISFVSVVVGFWLLFNLRIDYYSQYHDAQLQINRIIGTDVSVMGNQVYWFNLQGRKYMSWEELVYFTRRYPGSNIVDAFQYFQPDFFIIDNHVQDSILGVKEGSEYRSNLRLPEAELLEIINIYSDRVYKIDGGYLGEISIYKFQWDEK